MSNQYSPLTHDKIVHSINVGAAPRFVGNSSPIVAFSVPEKSITVSIRWDASISKTGSKKRETFFKFTEWVLQGLSDFSKWPHLREKCDGKKVASLEFFFIANDQFKNLFRYTKILFLKQQLKKFKKHFHITWWKQKYIFFTEAK